MGNGEKGKRDAAAAAVLHDNTASPRDDRRTRGKILREAIPLEKHAGWKLYSDREDVVSILQKGDVGRIPELIPIRYGRMVKTPFTYYRGAAAVMAADLAHTACIKVRVQACGDCHALNFGAFATPERNVVFDINDFDETLPAPWEWDLKRLAVSLVLIARDNEMKAKVCSEVAEAVTRSYREHITEYSRMSILDIWYARVDYENVVDHVSDPETKKSFKDELKKAQKRTVRSHYFPKMTQQHDGKWMIKDTPPLIYHMKDDKGFLDGLHKGFELYKQSLQEDKQRLLDRYKLCDTAVKVVGIGSVGTTCGIALMTGPDDDPLILQLKEARASVFEQFAGKSEFDNHGQRVVAGQRIMQSASDIFLGWMKLPNGRHFYVRQLRDTKVKIQPEFWDSKTLIGMAGVMGAVLARAHARSGDSTVISGYLGESDEFDTAIADFSLAYADQMEKDHAALLAAVKSGRIKIEDVD